MTDGLSLPVVAPLNSGNGNNNGFGGDWGAWIILFLIFGMFGWGGYGGWAGGLGNGGSAATQADIQRGFDTQSIIGKLDGISNGICDSTFAVTNAVNNLGTTVMQGFSQAEIARCNSQAAIMQQLMIMMSTAQQCCCDIRGDIKDLMYAGAKNTCDLQNTMNNNTRDILDNQNANARAILDWLSQKEAADLRAENQALKLAASQQAQNAYFAANQEAQTAELIRRLGKDYPVNAVVVQPNTPVTFPVNGCGTFTGYSGNGCCGYNNNCGTCCG